MSDSETEGRLDALAQALSEDDHDELGVSCAAGGKGKSAVKGKSNQEHITEPYSGIRYSNPKIKAEALDSSLDRFTPLHHLDKLKDAVATVSTIAIVGRRTASTSSKGSDYIKWQLTDLKECNVPCLLFANAAQALSQIRPGMVVALLRASYDGSQQGCLKLNDGSQVKEVGDSADFAYCAGHNRKGDRCQNVVNKSTCPFCDHHLQQGRKKLVMGARPECQGTVLGAVHGAQIKNAACLTKLSQRTPKKKKPQSLDQMRKCAGDISNQRSGSMGAKLIAKFVQQQHQATRSAKLDQEEAALYRSLEKDPNGGLVPQSLPACVFRASRPGAAVEVGAGHLKADVDLLRSTRKGAKRTAESLTQPGQAAKAVKCSNGASSKGQHDSSCGNHSAAQAGTCMHAGYVTDLLQELAADSRQRVSVTTKPGDVCKAWRPRTVSSKASTGQECRLRQHAAAVGASGSLLTSDPIPSTAGKTKRMVSTERRVRQVLTELQ